MLMLEWGLSWKEFHGTPDLVIGRMKEMIQAKSEGEKRKSDSDLRAMELEKLKNKNKQHG